jgi:hypothetical protein
MLQLSIEDRHPRWSFKRQNSYDFHQLLWSLSVECVLGDSTPYSFSIRSLAYFKNESCDQSPVKTARLRIL